MEELEAVTQVRAVCARPGDIFEKVKHISKFVEDNLRFLEDIFEKVADILLLFLIVDCCLLHLASNEVPGHGLHLETQTARVEFQTVVADHRGQDHLRRKAIYSRS